MTPAFEEQTFKYTIYNIYMTFLNWKLVKTVC